MTFVEEPIEFATPPPHEHLEVGVKRVKDATEHADAEVVDPSPLKGGDTTLAHGGTARDIDLAPAEAMPECARDPAEAEVAHAASVRDVTCRPLAGHLPAT